MFGQFRRKNLVICWEMFGNFVKKKEFYVSSWKIGVAFFVGRIFHFSKRCVLTGSLKRHPTGTESYWGKKFFQKQRFFNVSRTFGQKIILSKNTSQFFFRFSSLIFSDCWQGSVGKVVETAFQKSRGEFGNIFTILKVLIILIHLWAVSKTFLEFCHNSSGRIVEFALYVSRDILRESIFFENFFYFLSDFGRNTSRFLLTIFLARLSEQCLLFI